MMLPNRALSIRQPWAWAILHAGKDVENRSWDMKNTNRLWEHRGRIAVHASQGMARDEYIHAKKFMRQLGIECPHPLDDALQRGGIVGSVEIVDAVKKSDSPWFFGTLGLVLRDARPCEFTPVNGLLGFFDWRERRRGHEPVPVFKWMQEWEDAQ